ncbi:MAG: DUF1343 domain-containing protein, partial [Hyphomicrobiaceae bacterium]|nr:DUF1343 domain-containing protein [Hyphomicrobiaceae bacterium]
APWLDAAAVVRLMGAVDGAQVSDTVVRPESPPDGKYADQAIPAVRFRVTDRCRYDPVAAATALFAAVLELHSDSLTVREARLAQLAGTDALWTRLAAGASAATIAIEWRQGLEEFAGVREGYLLY